MTNKLCPHCGQPMTIPEEENEKAEIRCKQLNRLDNACAWDKFEFQLNQAQRLARMRYQQIMDAQTVFENKYC